MESLNFNLQIEMFLTVNDDWENKNIFYCVFNHGFFRSILTGSCYEWKDTYYHLGKVEKNKYNSFDLIEMDHKLYRTYDHALEELSKLLLTT